MVICADTSFLFSLYGTDSNTPRALAWIKASRTPLSVSPFNEFELGNALRFAEFRKAMASGKAAAFWAQFETDFASGRLVAEVWNLAAVIQEAKRLSSTYTLASGHRAFDILHVAAALQIHAGEFLTFDASQRKLAKAEGIKTPL